MTAIVGRIWPSWQGLGQMASSASARPAASKPSRLLFQARSADHLPKGHERPARA